MAWSARWNWSEDKATPRRRSIRRHGRAGGAAAALEEGVILRAIRDAVAICPPLIITEAQIADIVDRIKLALDDTLAWLEDGRPG